MCSFKIMLPTDPKQEEIKLSAKIWGERELESLGVDLYRRQTIDLNNIVLRVRESDWPSELRQRISGFGRSLINRCTR
jgi:hypothetical protein